MPSPSNSPGAGATSSSWTSPRTPARGPRARRRRSSAWESWHQWRDWGGYLEVEDPTGTARLVDTGALVLDTPGGSSRSALRLLDAVGVPREELTAAQIRAAFPAVDPTCYGPPRLPDDEEFWREGHEELVGYYTPGAGYVDDPQLAAHNLMVAAEYAGARFRFRSRVVEVLQARGRVAGVLLGSGERVHAPVVVNVAGPAADIVNRLAGVTDDMRVRSRPLRVETHLAPAPPDFVIGGGGVFVTDLDLGSAFRPQAGDLVHISGIEPECDPLDWVEDPEKFGEKPTLDAYERQVYRVARRLPGLTVEGRPRGLAALYDVTPDWAGLFDRSGLDGFYMACGTSGNAFKNAPVIGRLMSELIDAVENGRDHDRDPVHVELPNCGRTVGLAPFSRLRTIAAGAATNVLG